ncbi:MAG: hypothetical protein ABWY55_01190 [Microbacterium sp.]
MPSALPCDSSTARAVLDVTARQLSDARTRLQVIRARAAVLADETAWQTPSAREFRERIAEWREDLARLDAEADRVRDELWWVRTELESRSWGGGS